MADAGTILNFPQSTIVDSVVPKTKFYRFMEVNPRMKAHFVDDVESIRWLYKLSPDTLNVSATEEMPEVEVFLATLKQADCPTDLFTFIDTHMPRHLVFVLQHEGSSMLLINYKQWKDDSHTAFRITQMFASPWMPTADLRLGIEGQTLPRIYDNFVAQISGIGEHHSGSMEEIVTLRQRIDKESKELEQLERRMRREQQVDRQMQLHAQVRNKRQEIEKLKMKMEEMGV